MVAPALGIRERCRGVAFDTSFVREMEVDVNATLGNLSPHARELEIAIPRRIDPSDILGVTPLNADGSDVGFTILNWLFRN